MAFSELVDNLRTRVNEKADPDKIANLDAVFQFVITGDDGGSFYGKVSGGEIEIAEGTDDNPSVTFTMSITDFYKMQEGKLNSTSAFMAGKLKIKGNMALAMKLQSLIG